MAQSLSDNDLAMLLSEANALADKHKQDSDNDNDLNGSHQVVDNLNDHLNFDDGFKYDSDDQVDARSDSKSSAKRQKKEKKSSKKDKKEKKSSKKEKKSNAPLVWIDNPSTDEDELDPTIKSMVDYVENAKKVATQATSLRSERPPVHTSVPVIGSDGDDSDTSGKTGLLVLPMENNGRQSAKVKKMGSKYVESSSVRDQHSSGDDSDNSGDDILFKSATNSRSKLSNVKATAKAVFDVVSSEEEGGALNIRTPTKTPKKTKDVSNYLRDEDESNNLVQLFTEEKSPVRAKRASPHRKNAEKARKAELEQLKKQAIVKVKTSASTFLTKDNSSMVDSLFDDFDSTYDAIKVVSSAKMQQEKSLKAKEKITRKSIGQLTSTGLRLTSSSDDDNNNDDGYIGFTGGTGIKGMGGIVGVNRGGAKKKDQNGQKASSSSDSDFDLTTHAIDSDFEFDEDENVIEHGGSNSDNEISSAMESDSDHLPSHGTKMNDDSDTTDQETWENDIEAFKERVKKKLQGVDVPSPTTAATTTAMTMTIPTSTSSVSRNDSKSETQTAPAVKSNVAAAALAMAKRLSAHRSTEISSTNTNTNTITNSSTNTSTSNSKAGQTHDNAERVSSRTEATSISSTTKTTKPTHSNPLFDSSDEDIFAKPKTTNILNMIKKAETEQAKGVEDREKMAPTKSLFDLESENDDDDEVPFVRVYHGGNSDDSGGSDEEKSSKGMVGRDRNDQAQVSTKSTKSKSKSKSTKSKSKSKSKSKKKSKKSKGSSLMGDSGDSESSLVSDEEGSGSENGSESGNEGNEGDVYSDSSSSSSSEGELDPEESQRRLERRVEMLAALQRNEKAKIKEQREMKWVGGGEVDESDGEGGVKSKVPTRPSKAPKIHKDGQISSSSGDDVDKSDEESEDEVLSREELLAQAMFIADDEEADREMRRLGGGHRGEGSIMDQEEEAFIRDLKAQEREVMRQQKLQLEKEQQRKKMMRHSFFDDEFYGGNDGDDSDGVYDTGIIRDNIDLTKKEQKLLQQVQLQRGKQLSQEEIDIILGGNAEQRRRRAELKKLEEEKMDRKYSSVGVSLEPVNGKDRKGSTKAKKQDLSSHLDTPSKGSSLLSTLNKTLSQHQRGVVDVPKGQLGRFSSEESTSSSGTSLSTSTSTPLDSLKLNTDSDTHRQGSTRLDEPDFSSDESGGDHSDASTGSSSESDSGSESEIDLEDLDEADCPSKSSDPQGYKDFMDRIKQRDSQREKQQLLLFAQHHSAQLILAKSSEGKSPLNAVSAHKSNSLARFGSVLTPNASAVLTPSPSNNSSARSSQSTNHPSVPKDSADPRMMLITPQDTRSMAGGAAVQRTASVGSLPGSSLPRDSLRTSFSTLQSPPSVPQNQTVGPKNQHSKTLARNNTSNVQTHSSTLFSARPTLARNSTFNELLSPLAQQTDPQLQTTISPATDFLGFGSHTNASTAAIAPLGTSNKAMKKQVVLSRDLVQVERFEPLEREGNSKASRTSLQSSVKSSHSAPSGPDPIDFNSIRGKKVQSSSTAQPQGPTKHNASHLFDLEDDLLASAKKKPKNRSTSKTADSNQGPSSGSGTGDSKALLNSLKSFGQHRK